MPQVSLTTFVDFVTSSATKRLTRVRDAKKYYEAGYATQRDFYLPLRNRIVEAFEAGWDPKAFDIALAEVTDPKKQEIYKRARAGLRKWAGVSGKKTYKWIKPKKATWSSNGLDVGISPELWLEIDGEKHVIKLFTKSDPLTQLKANLILRLMDREVGKFGKVGVLDLQRGKLFVQTQQPPPGIDALLDAEAAAFALIWNAL